jgi:sec-independent protein translocase protein TatB
VFDIASTELLLVVLIALVVIGPKDLPKLLRFVGNWVGKARSVMAQFRSGIDDMLRESELKELEEKWKKQNEEIMRDYPLSAPAEEAEVGESYADSDMVGDNMLDNELDNKAEPVPPAAKKPVKKPATKAKAARPKAAKPGTKPV